MKTHIGSDIDFSQSPRKAVPNHVASFLEHALQSATSFSAGILVLHTQSKESYAQFSILVAVVLLFQGLQNAALLSPLQTVLPSTAQNLRSALRRYSYSIQIALTALFCLLWFATGWLSLTFFPPIASEWVTIFAAGGMYMVGLLAKEFSRGVLFAQHRHDIALRQATIYVALTATLLISLGQTNLIRSDNVLIALGLAALVSSWFSTSPFGRQPLSSLSSESEHHLRESKKQLWSCAKWSLPSVVASWGYNNAYVVLVAGLSSPLLVADLAASRMLIVPATLVFSAWFNTFRPRSSAWFHLGLHSKIASAATRASFAFSLLALFLGLLVVTVLNYIEDSLLRHDYRGLSPLVMLWFVFFAATAVRSAGMACVLSSERGFRLTNSYSWYCSALGLCLVLVATLLKSAVGVILALITAEILFAGLVWRRGWLLVKRA